MFMRAKFFTGNNVYRRYNNIIMTIVQNIRLILNIRTVPLKSDRITCSTTILETVGNGYTENSCRCTSPTRSCPGTCNCLRYKPIFPTATRE